MKTLTISVLMLALSSCLLVASNQVTTFNQRTFNNDLTITGDFIGKQITAEENITINGYAKLIESTVQGKTNVNGNLTAVKTTFEDDIVVTALSPKVDLTDTTAEKITIVSLPPVKKEAGAIQKVTSVEASKEKVLVGSVTQKETAETNVPKWKSKAAAKSDVAPQKEEPKTEAVKTEPVKEEIATKIEPAMVTLNGTSKIEEIIFVGNPGVVILKGTSSVEEKIKNGEYRS